ncbi:hypothetical protein [Dyella solisilvae]|nr:hypothetical protein [Dyella solisilvae]
MTTEEALTFLEKFVGQDYVDPVAQMAQAARKAIAKIKETMDELDLASPIRDRVRQTYGEWVREVVGLIDDVHFGSMHAEARSTTAADDAQLPSLYADLARAS